MPKNACERGIYHVMEYAFFSKCPKIEDVHFRFIFCFLNQKGKMGHFKKIEHRKVGHFEKKARDQLKTENESILGHFEKNPYSIT